MIQPVTTRDLEEYFTDEAFVVLDSRPAPAYNGWPLRGETRGGHVPGAVSVPLDWLDELEDAGIRSMLMQKGVTQDKTIIVTGYTQHDSEAMATCLAEMEYSSVRTHSGGMTGWLSDPRLPVLSLSRFRHLVHPEWVKNLVNGDDPEPGGMGRHILAHVNFDNRGDYDQGHIPGAIWLDTLVLEDEGTWNRRTPAEIEEELRAHGITRDTCVVLYGRTANPNMAQEQPGKQAGQIGAMRAAAILMYTGVRDVRVLDGGINAWLRAGGTVSREETPPVPVKDTGLRIPEHPEYMIDTPEAKRMLADPNAELVSMRSWREYIGEVSGYHYIGPAGRIPGAIFGDCGSDAYHMEHYRNRNDTMLSYHEIAAHWHDMDITPDKHIAFYCGTGWRASEAFFDAWLMGWENVSVYDGGWLEWSADPDNPVETGIP